MPLSPWLTFRQAREALRSGQPDEARRLVAPYAAEGYRKAIKLTREVARTYLTRAERHLRADDPEAAWRDLLAAEALNTGEEEAVRLRYTLTRLGLAECRAALEAGSPAHVIEAAARLVDRQAGGPELAVLEEVAQDWLLASEQADRGDFLLARDTLGRARAKLDAQTAAGPARFAADLDRRHERFRVAIARLNESVESRDWPEAVRWADEAVAVAPNHRDARSLRGQAWDALRPVVDAGAILPLAVSPAGAGRAADTRTWPGGPDSTPRRSPVSRTTRSFHPAAGGDDVPDPLPLPKRFLLWIDGVGGYLVCLSPRVTFGQATGDAPVDVPLFADVARLHAELSRDAEGYVLESARDVQVNGAAVKKATLACGDRLTLGATCQFLFRRPVPISPTARLELVSGHRMPLAVDGVLLMAESLILGPAGKSHVVLPDKVPGPVILYRSKDGLGVRFDGPFQIDGRPCDGRSPLSLPGVVNGEQFTFAVEPAGPRL